MKHPRDHGCPRTDAILAVHLDGDPDVGVGSVAHESADLGYGFVEAESLQRHLRDCAVCQLALRRARRLDAALAAQAGQVVGDHVRERGTTFDALAEHWLQTACAAATDRRADEANPAPAASCAPAEQATVGNDDEARSGTLLAASLLLAAAAASWWCLRPVDADSTAVPAPARAPLADASAVNHPIPGGQIPGGQIPGGQSGPGTEQPPAMPTPPIGAAERTEPDTSLAQALHRRERALPEQRATATRVYGERVADRSLQAAERLAAAEHLLQVLQTRSTAAPKAMTALLEALAGYGDRTRHEALVHDELLELVRDSRPFQRELLQRIDDTHLHNRRGLPLDRPAIAAIVVAARCDQTELDVALRRAARRHPGVIAPLAAALRCGARSTGCAELLLACWHDQVALGHQIETPETAAFWFRGQSDSTFASLPALLRSLHSTPERVRCLLAMGCDHCDRPVQTLLTALESPHRAIASAAACSLSCLPHSVLEPLLPQAGRDRTGLLRAALARAGLAGARPWLRTLALSADQRRRLRDAPVRHFAEVALWFRNRIPAAE